MIVRCMLNTTCWRKKHQVERLNFGIIAISIIMALRQEGYWDEHYKEELKNYLEDKDEGEIWFGKGLSRKIVDWLITRLRNNDRETTRFDVIDIGCGNSFTLCSLVEKFRNQFGDEKLSAMRALGIDYSASSISLSAEIIRDKQLSGTIELQQCDFINLSQLRTATQGRSFDYIIDKGTYDAICLLASDSEERLEQTKDAYAKSVWTLVKPNSIFILASCNHTEQELLPLFDRNEVFLARSIGKIETPTLKFGGKSGSQVTCLIFEFMSHR